jgi:hypothetical protein
MPFEGTRYQRRSEVLDKIGQVIQLLSDEQRWCKRQLVSFDGRRCILGALIAVDALTLKKPIRLAIEQVTGEYYFKLEAFNDHPQTTHALVMKVLQQARANIANSQETASQAERVPLKRFWDVFR